MRARGFHPFFKIVLITNASGLDRPEVQSGLTLLTPRDEIWAKLEVGTQRFEWTKNDIVIAPNFLWRRHKNTGATDAIIYSVSDAALLRNIGEGALWGALIRR